MDGHHQVPDELAVRVHGDAMHATVSAIFQRLGMSAPDAQRCADVLIYADLRGIDSHGVSNMMPIYVRWLREDWINPTAAMEIERESPATATVNSHHGLGLTIGPQAMDLAIEKARATGIGSVVVNNGRHCGAAAYHAHMALDHDMIGIAMTIGGVVMLPTFGAQPMVGSNPIAVAAPTRTEQPFVFDAATTSVAVNRIKHSARLGIQIPGGWIGGEDGAPILEPGTVPETFRMLPTGGSRENGSHKGYGLGVAVDILCGLLGGMPAGVHRNPSDVSHHFLAYRIDAFTDVDEFKDHMDAFMRALRECPPAPGHNRVYYAGLPEYETEQERRARGIPYHPEVIQWFRETCAELEIGEPAVVGG